MKQLTCELCEGTDFVKQDGMFVCQNCGTKYTVEEAKKMMAGEAGAPAPAVNTRSADADRFRKLALDAFEADNHDEALTYAGRVLEIDCNDYVALYIKGTSTAWKSTTVNLRLKEAILYWTQALENVPVETDEARKLCDDIASDFCQIVIALKSLYIKQVSNAKNLDSNTKAVINLDSYRLGECIKMMIAYNQRVPEEQRKTSAAHSLTNGQSKLPVSVYKEALRKIADNTYSTLRIYKGSDMSNSCFEKYKFHTSAWVMVFGLATEDRVEALNYATTIYRRTVEVLRECQFNTSNMVNVIGQIQDQIKKTEQELAKKAAEEKAKRVKAYWEEHPEAKADLEERKAELEREIRALRGKIGKLEESKKSVPALAERTRICKQIDDLTTQKNSLGLFKGKEKKALQEQIDALIVKRTEQERIVDSQRAEIDTRIAPIQEELDERKRALDYIEQELTRDR